MTCKRCLTEQISAEAYNNIREYVSLIPSEKKADDMLYKCRLAKCQDCDCLINAMCRKCGCFVEIRAAYAHNRCPHEQRRW